MVFVRIKVSIMMKQLSFANLCIRRRSAEIRLLLPLGPSRASEWATYLELQTMRLGGLIEARAELPPLQGIPNDSPVQGTPFPTWGLPLGSQFSTNHVAPEFRLA